MLRTLCIGLSLPLVVLLVTQVSGADPASSIQTIRAVDHLGKGNQEAAAAWRDLVKQPASALPAILTGFDGANPIATNYLRGAVETIVARTLDAGGKLPVVEIEKFVFETAHDPRARRLAFELLAQVDPQAPDRIIPKMLNDPSVELRRDAVARLLTAARELLKTDNGKDEARKTLAQALDGARDDDQVQDIKKHLEELGEKVDLSTHFGFLPSWKLIAPFDNTDKKGLGVAYPPEKMLDVQARYEGKEGKEISWQDYTTENEYGIVDLAKVLSPFKGAVAYATTEFQSDKDHAVEFRLGTPNAWKVWLNGDLLFAREEYHRGMSVDQYRMTGKLKAGKNVILLKICQNEQTEEWAQRWQYQLRVCDATGTAILSADRGAGPKKSADSTTSSDD